MSKPTIQFAFDMVKNYVMPDGQVVIEWVLNQAYQLKAEIDHFYVEFSYGGEWCKINEEDILDCIYVDSDSKRCSLSDVVYYRVIAVDALGGEYVSKPSSVLECLSKYQWRIVRDIMRKEYLRFRTQGAGIKCSLLKKRQHGPKCTACTDHDTGEPVNSTCEECYGTGFIGGYYDAIPFWVENNVTVSKKDENALTGVTDTRARTARAVACPTVETYDVIVSSCKNRRFVVRSVQEIMAVEFMPVIYKITLMELAPKSPQYDIPLEQELCEIYEEPEYTVEDKHVGGFDEFSITKQSKW